MNDTDSDAGLWRTVHIAQGLFLGVFLVSLLLFSGQEPWLDYVGKKLQDWQTMIAAFIALYAAKLTVDAVRQQIRKQEEIEQNRLKRRHNAARASMPAALSELTGYAEKCLDLLRSLNRDRYGHITEPVLFKPPNIGEGSISVLRDCIETGDEDTSRVIGDLLMKLQIQHSRFRNLANVLKLPDDRFNQPLRWETYVVDALEIYHRCGQMYAYGRRRADSLTAEIDVGQLHNLMISTGFEDEHEVAKRIREAFPSGKEGKG